MTTRELIAAMAARHGVRCTRAHLRLAERYGWLVPLPARLSYGPGVRQYAPVHIEQMLEYRCTVRAGPKGRPEAPKT